MTYRKFLLMIALGTATAPALGAVSVLGSTSARMCFEAADSSGAATGGIRYCDEALVAEALSARDRVATHVNRGILRMQRGALDAAILDFDSAIAQDAQQPEAYLNKGVALLRRPSGYDEALPLFTTAIEKKTRRPEIAYLGRGIAHELNGQVRAAYRDYKQAQALAPSWKQPALQLERFQVVRN